MRLSDRARPPWLAATPAATLLAVSTFVALLSALLVASAALSGAARRSSGGGSDVAGQIDADLETPVVEVLSRDDGAVYRLGGREAGSATELRRLLEPLARLGGPISVRTSHDAPFARSVDGITACREAGFREVLLVTGDRGH